VHGTTGAAGDQGGTASGLHAIQGYGNAIDGIGAAAFGNREGALAQGAHHHVAFTRHGAAIEVGVGDGFGDNAAVVGYVIESNNTFHIDCPRDRLLMKFNQLNKRALK
jgi:hypothetical protein